VSTSIFQSVVTAARVATNPGGLKSSFKFTGGSDANQPTLNCIATDIQIQENVNVNVMYAADGRTFLHVPGDKVAAVSVTGIAFREICNAVNSAAISAIGAEYLYSWYHANKVSAAVVSSGTGGVPHIQPIELLLGTQCSLKCYLVGATLQVRDLPAHLFGFTLSLLKAPDITAVAVPNQAVDPNSQNATGGGTSDPNAANNGTDTSNTPDPAANVDNTDTSQQPTA
jgi:hypothetical protein